MYSNTRDGPEAARVSAEDPVGPVASIVEQLRVGRECARAGNSAKVLSGIKGLDCKVQSLLFVERPKLVDERRSYAVQNGLTFLHPAGSAKKERKRALEAETKNST